MMELYTWGFIKAIEPCIQVPATKIEQAIHILQRKDSQIGAITVTIPEAPTELIIHEKKRRLKLEGGSYLLAGGLGGLGQAVARWLAEAGAKESESAKLTI